MPEVDLDFSDDLDRRLRDLLQATGLPVATTGVVESVRCRAARRRRRARVGGVLAAAMVAIGVVGGITWTVGDGWASGRLATGAPTSIASQGHVNASSPAQSARSSAARAHPAPRPAPCPSGLTIPSVSTGSYCGPPPPEGNGLGPGGECTGKETIAPCGPGVVPGRYYAYTLPASCDGLIIFDGRKWLSELPHSSPSTSYQRVWMAMRGGPVASTGFISPYGVVGFIPYVGQPIPSCHS